MDIDYAIQTRIQNIVHDFVDAVHPLVIHLARRIHVDTPRHRHADGTETCVTHHGHELGTGHRLTPPGLPLPPVPSVRVAGPERLQRVSEIPAYAHVGNSLIRCLKDRDRLGFRLRIRLDRSRLRSA